MRSKGVHLLSDPSIRLDVSGGIAKVTLSRPDKLNSFTAAMHEELRNALDTIAADPAMRVLLLTAAGRAFCAGQDLSDRVTTPGDEAPDLGETVERDWNPLVRRLVSMPFPTVCAVNGTAAGAGVSIALACDIVIAAQSAKFIQSFAKIGLIPDTGGTWILPRLVGQARALGLALTGEALSASRAAEWGLIWKCVADAELAAESDRLIEWFAHAPTRGLAATRRLMRESWDRTLDQELDLQRDTMRELGRTEDYREGVTAFVQKRAAVFHGR